MRPFVLPALLLLILALLPSCANISATDASGTPTVYAKVLSPPNPLLMGHYRRSPPSEFNHPWAFSYWLVKKGDKYAVYYFYDSHKKNSYSGWAEFTINGDSMISPIDGVTFFVENGEVRMSWPGRKETHRMTKED